MTDAKMQLAIFTDLTLPADDPLWWEAYQVALLAGTRLELAVQEHRKTVARLTRYRDQLAQLQRSCICCTLQTTVATWVWQIVPVI